MKKVIFKSLKIQNYLSVGNNPVCIDFKKGINLVTGINKDKPDRRNAIGKSTVADALYFGIFGDPLREIKKDLIVNNITGGTTTIEIECDVVTPKETNTYKLIRKLNPSKVYIYKDGEDATRDTISNTNKYICDTLSATPSLFQNCVIMTVNNAIPFMAKNKVEKRKFIEDIFGLEVFSQMISELRGEYNNISKEYDLEQAKFSEVNRSTFDYKKQRQKILDHRTQKHQVYLQRQQENDDTWGKLDAKLAGMVFWDSSIIQENISKLQTGIKKCESVITDKNLLVGEYTTRIKTLKSTYEKIGTDQEECPVCLRSIKDHDAKYIKEEKVKIEIEIDNLTKLLKATKDEIISIQQKKDAVNKKLKDEEGKIAKNKLLNQEEKNILEKIQQIKKWQESLIDDINQVTGTSTEFDGIIEDTEKRLSELDQTIIQKKQQIQMLDVVKYVISEEGVKSYIVNKLLELLNSRLLYYLKKLDSNAICYFNEFFEEELVNDKNKICSYFNFSGAERKSVDLACLFTFSDLRRMQGGVQYNIAFYDELFDSSFDEKGIELISDLLKERSDQFDECIYIISHRLESLKSVTGEVIFLEKENGITNRVEFKDI